MDNKRILQKVFHVLKKGQQIEIEFVEQSKHLNGVYVVLDKQSKRGRTGGSTLKVRQCNGTAEFSLSWRDETLKTIKFVGEVSPSPSDHVELVGQQVFRMKTNGVSKEELQKLAVEAAEKVIQEMTKLPSLSPTYPTASRDKKYYN